MIIKNISFTNSVRYSCPIMKYWWYANMVDSLALDI